MSRKSTASAIFGVVAVGVMLLVLAATPAQAATELISFEEIPAGADLTTQYAARGITFGKSLQNTTERGPSVASVTPRTGSRSLWALRTEGEIVFPFSTGRLTSPSRFFSIWSHGGALEAYGAGGQFLDSETTPDNTVYRQLRIDRPTAEIAFVILRDEGGVFDDMSYETPAPGAPPEFGVQPVLSGFFGGEVALTQGTTVQIPLRLNRFAGSTGPVDVTATTPVGSGVIASVAPSPIPANGSILTLTAAASAPAADGVKISVTGTSRPAEGSLKRTTTFPVDVVATFDAQVTGIEVTQGIQTEVVPCTPSKPVWDVGMNLLVGSFVADADWENVAPASAIGQYFSTFDADLAANLKVARDKTCKENVSLPRRLAPGTPVLYSGLRMVRGGRTIVRVYGGLRGSSDGSIPRYLVTLRAKSAGKTLKGGPLLPESGPRQLTRTLDWTTYADRVDPDGAWTFTLPPAWTTKSTLELTADLQLVQDAAIGAASECAGAVCAGNNSLTMFGIPFVKVNPIKVAPVRVWYTNESDEYGPDGANGELDSNELRHLDRAACRAKDSAQKSDTTCETVYPRPFRALELAVAMAPLPEGGLVFDPTRYYTSLNVDEFKGQEDSMADARGKLDDLADDFPGCQAGEFCADTVLGINGPQIGNGLARGMIGADLAGLDVWDPVASALWTRPATSVAHELFHTWDVPHKFTDLRCASADQLNQVRLSAYDLTGQGFLRGIGLDRRTNSGGTVQAPYRVYGSKSLGASVMDVRGGSGTPAAQNVYDLMSYCSGIETADSKLQAWISPDTWNQLIDELSSYNSPFASRAATSLSRTSSARATQAGLSVRASFAAGKGTIEDVSPVQRLRQRGGSPFRVQALDATGKVLADVVAAAENGSGASGTVSSGTEILADLPIRATPAKIVLLRNGTRVGERARSQNQPKVRLTRAPRRGQKIGARKVLALAWSASDGDGERLDVAVDFSTDRGRTWRPLTGGAGLRSLRVQTAELAASRTARIRVTASDGYDQATAVSKIFRSAGSRPRVSITAPASNQKLAGGSTVYLAGTATDDAGRPIAGRRLTWFAGKRRIARGASASLAGLPAGATRLRLVARDRVGRTGSASVRIRGTAIAPKFLVLKAPKRISRRAKRVRLRVAATMPATLRVGTRRFRVDRKTRKVTVRVKRGSKPLKLTLRLSVGGKTAVTQVVILRS